MNQMSMKKVNQHSEFKTLFVQKFQGNDIRITIEYLGGPLQAKIMEILSTREWIRTADITEILQTEYPEHPRGSVKKSLRSLEQRGFVTCEKRYDTTHNPFYQNYWRTNL